MIDQPTLVEKCPTHELHYRVQCMSWSAIFIGALISIGIAFLLNLFGISIGLAAFTTTKEGLIALAIGGFIAMAIGTIVCMFFSGWIAGYLGRTRVFNCHIGLLYGLATWCLSLVLTIVLAAHTTQFISTHYYMLTHSDHNIVAAANYNDPIVDRNQAINQAVLQNQGIHNDNTTTAVDAEKVAHAASVSLFLTFLLFFLGAAASCAGGYYGYRPCCHKEEIVSTNRPQV